MWKFDMEYEEIKLNVESEEIKATSRMLEVPWKCYIGPEVYLERTWLPQALWPIIKRRKTLKLGSRVLIKDCWPWSGDQIVTIDYLKGSQAGAMNGDLHFILSYGKDDRNCWVCDSISNVGAFIRAYPNWGRGL